MTAVVMHAETTPGLRAADVGATLPWSYLLHFAVAVVLWRVSRSAVVLALPFKLAMAAYVASSRPGEMLLPAQLFADPDAAEPS